MDAIQITSALDEVLDFLVSSPTLEKIVEFQLSEAAQERAGYLLEQSRNGDLTAEEHKEMDDLLEMNHLFIILRARARKKLMSK